MGAGAQRLVESISGYDTVTTSPHAPPRVPIVGVMPDFHTLTRRPILQVGTWNASTGEESITDEDLASIVSAYKSGVLDAAVVKIGHTDPRFNAYLEDGSPAYGTVENLHVEDGVLYADYVNVPAQLADILDSAYPRSSVELARNVKLRDQDGDVVHEFDCVLTANALLGATPPAVKGLSTKEANLSEDQLDYTTQIITAQFSLPGKNTAMTLGDKLSAAVNEKHSTETSYAYVEDFDDEAVIFTVEDYNGSRASYRQTYSIEDNAAPQLAEELTRVIRESRWVAEGEQIAASETRHEANVDPQTEDLAHSMSEAPPAPSDETPTKENPPMPTVDKDKAAEIRRKLDLPSNAGYEDILAAVLESNPEAIKPKDVAPGTDETENDERTAQQEAENAARQAYNMSEDEGKADKVDISALAEKLGGKFVSESAFSALQAEHQAMRDELAARKADETKARRDGLVSKWFSEGKIGRDEVETVRAELESAEEPVARIIDRREPIFPTQELGHSANDESHFALGTDATKADALHAVDDDIFG